MVNETVANLMMELAALSFIVPLLLALIWKMRYRKSIIPTFVGMLIFITFAIGLESVPHMFFLRVNSPVSRFITNNPIVYAVYGGFMAALFEEAGRYIAYRFLMMKYDYKESAVAYGIGHGGVECMIVLGVAQLQNYTYAQLINSGKIDSMKSVIKGKQAQEAFGTAIEAIKNMTVSDCVWAGIERISAMALQIALSILVYKAVKVSGQRHYLLIAGILHMIADIPAGFYQMKVLPLEVTEIIIFIYSAIVTVFAIKEYKNLPKQEDEKENEVQKFKKTMS